jgi:hypothetical protein
MDYIMAKAAKHNQMNRLHEFQKGGGEKKDRRRQNRRLLAADR